MFDSIRKQLDRLEGGLAEALLSKKLLEKERWVATPGGAPAGLPNGRPANPDRAVHQGLLEGQRVGAGPLLA